MEQFKTQIKQICESSIQRLEQQKNADLQNLRQRVMQEKVLPFNADIDKSYNLAVTQLSDTLNKKIQSLQAQFAQEKEALLQACNKKKSDNQEAILASETSALCYTYDSVIATYRKQIEDLGE